MLCVQVRRELFPIVNRNKYRRDATSAYQLLAEQQRPAGDKKGSEWMKVSCRGPGGARRLWVGGLVAAL